MFSKLTLLSVSVSLLLLAACGKSDSSSVPSATNPSSGSTTSISTSTSTTDPRLPDLSTAVPLNLVDNTKYSGLMAIANVVYPPLVGDPEVAMTIIGDSRATTVTGGILVSFEDAQGFWGAQLAAFAGVNTRTATSLDMTFADDDIVLRATAAINGDTVNGLVYYRVRQLGEEQCKSVVVTCEPVGGTATGSTTGTCNTTYDTVTPCVNYMNLNNSAVVKLGSFQASYAKWSSSK